MTSPPDWVIRTPTEPRIHTEPTSTTYQWQSLTQDELTSIRTNLVESILQVVVQAVAGLFTPGGIGAAFDQLSSWAQAIGDAFEDVPILGDIVHAITGVIGGGLEALSDFFDGFTGEGSLLAQIVEALTGVLSGGLDDLVDWASNLPFIGDIIDALASGKGPIQGLIDWAEELFARLTHTPVASLGVDNTNYLSAGDFSSADTVVAAGGWSWDGSTGHTSNGSAKVTADSYVHELLSNVVFVSEGQQLTCTVWEKHTSLTYTGTNPVSLTVVEYSDRAGAEANIVGIETVAAFESPSATTSFTEMTGAYTVPTGVSCIRLRMTVAATATAGTVWYDDATVTRDVGVVADQHVPGITTILGNVIYGLEDLLGVDINHDGALGAYQGTAAALRANTSAIAYLNALLTGGTSMVDDFERNDSNNMGSSYWSQVYSGSGDGEMETDGHAVIWDKSGIGQRACKARWIGTPSVTNTDRQKIVAVLGSKGEYNPTFSKTGYNYLYGRMNSDGTHNIRATFGADGEVSIGYAAGSGYVNWVTTDIGSDAAPGNGATIELECGKHGGSDDRYYVARINGAQIISYDETGTSSSMGASYRGVGCGMSAEGHILILVGQMRPAKYNSFAAWDF